jgi:hypothetical protein
LARLGHDVAGYSSKGPFVPENPTPGLTVEIIDDERDSFPAIAHGRFDAHSGHFPLYSYILTNVGITADEKGRGEAMGWGGWAD